MSTRVVSMIFFFWWYFHFIETSGLMIQSDEIHVSFEVGGKKKHHLVSFFKRKKLCGFYGTCLVLQNSTATVFHAEFILELSDHNKFCCRFFPPKITVPSYCWRTAPEGIDEAKC